jgi:hypothetical protein
MGAMTDETSTGRLRLFVAIPIPEQIRGEIARVQLELQSLVPRHAMPAAFRLAKNN